jgi:hypothetical protein
MSKHDVVQNTIKNPLYRLHLLNHPYTNNFLLLLTNSSAVLIQEKYHLSYTCKYQSKVVLRLYKKKNLIVNYCCGESINP